MAKAKTKRKKGNKICAAGTGSFLEEQAERFNIEITDFGDKALKAKNPLNLGERCTVFMETNVYSHYEKGANIEDIFSWCNRFSGVNVGIVTGSISKLAVIDIDDPNLLPELKEYLPEIKETTRVRTRRGYHYYFSLNGEYVKSTNSLFGRRLELKSNGNYVVAPPSIIKAHQYVYEIPLSEMLPIPKLLINKEREPVY